MARKRRASAQGALFAVVILALGLVGPIIILGAWAYFEYGRRPGSPDYDVRLRRADLDQELAEIEDLRERLSSTGEGEGIPRRTDGYFDGRSTVGRSLNTQLTSLDEQYAEGADLILRSDALEAKAKGARIAAATWVGVFALLHVRMPDLGLYKSTIASAVGMLVGYFTYRARLA